MLKRDTLGKASARSLNEAFKCGECLHYKNHSHSSREKVCAEEGVKPFGIAPKCFTPNVTALAQNSDQFVQIATMFESFTPKQCRLLLAVLRGSKNMNRKIKFGTKLYFKIGKDYISNYVCGYAVAYTSSGELVLMGSPDVKTRGSSFTAYFKGNEGLLTHSEWLLKRKELIQKNLLFDPDNRIVKKSSVKDDYIPPTIDSNLQIQEGVKKKVRVRKDTYEFQVR